MLTVKAPIELICNTSISPSHEAFYHRIIGNYEVMASGITGEDLLHVVTAPPEIYLGEGGMTSLTNNTQINSRQETKLEMINNLLNRIVLNEDVNLTYQDRVYITEVLSKLGVRNVQQFMNQVNQLKQETNDTQQLLSVYWSHLEELTEKVQEYQNLYEQEQRTTENVQQTERLHLHEDIFNRLQTGAIYQILNNFYSEYNGSSWYVSGPELQITEQKRMAANILLNQLESVIQGEEVPLVYRHENYYETMDIENVRLDESFLNSQITSAVLLSLIDNLYLNRFEKSQHAYESWLSMENALYQTAENTILRLRTGMTDIYNMQDSREEISLHQQRYQQELSLVYQILRGDIPEEDGLLRESPLPEISWQNQTIHQNQPEAAYLTQVEEEQLDLTLQQSDTELLQEEIFRINQQNIENYNRYRQILSRRQEQEEPPRRDNRSRMRQESLMALTNLDGLLEEYREEAEKKQEQADIRVQELLKLLPEQTRQIYETLSQEQLNLETIRSDVKIGRNNIGMLLHDIETVEQNRELTLRQAWEEQQNEQVREVSENVIERWNGQTALRETAGQSRIETVENDISLIHRSTENQLNEEMLQELLSQTRLLNRQTEVTQKEETSTQIVNRTVNHQEVHQRTLVEDTENINEMIREGVQRQINALSEQVYNKLEKRLQNERRRRGY